MRSAYDEDYMEENVHFSHKKKKYNPEKEAAKKARRDKNNAKKWACIEATGMTPAECRRQQANRNRRKEYDD